MKDPSDRTKVVLRRLPPSLSVAALTDQIDGNFYGRYNWVSFRPGKNSQKNQQHSRAYIDFKKPEDVVEFAEFFNGHIFVNEKGAQFKALVEYAPSQRVPKACSKKDGREGTLLNDPEYLEFLEHLSKPTENLPSAEIQLERREAEKAGGLKEKVIVTPLMEFIRQKRASKSGSKRSSANGKIRRPGGHLSSNSNPSSSRRRSEKQRLADSMYILTGNTKNIGGKDKSTYILMTRRNEQILSDKSVSVTSAGGTEVLEDGSVSGGVETGKRQVMIMKAKEKETSHASGSMPRQQNIQTPIRNVPGLTRLKQNQRNEATGMIRSILSNKEGGQSRSNLDASLPEQHTQTMNLDKAKLPPRPPSTRPLVKDLITGSQRPGGRRASARGMKEVEVSPIFSEGKPSKRGGPAGYGPHERRVWVQKSGSGS